MHGRSGLPTDRATARRRLAPFVCGALLFVLAGGAQAASAATLSGQVQKSDGTPARSVGVEVSTSSQSSASTTTDADGRYSFFLPAGSYRLSTGADVGGYGVVAVIDTVALGDDDVVEDITLPPPGTLTINVDKADGTPAEGVRITVNSTGHATGQTSNGSAINFYAYPGPTSNGPCVTDADGNCTLHYVAGVGVGFTVTPTTGLSTTGGGTPTIDGNTVHVTLPDSSSTLSGTLLRSDGSPAASVGVEASSQSQTASTTTDAGGHYSFSLPAGSYRLSTGADVGGYGVVAVIDTVVLNGDDVVEDITLPPPGTLTVSVNKPDGSPAQGVRITVNSTGHATGQTSNGSAINFYAYPGPTSNGPCVTDADGNCTLHYVAGVGVGFTVTPTTGLSTTGGGTPSADGNTVTVTLPASTSTLSGTLRRSDGSPAGSAGVEVSSQSQTASTTTDSDGHYSFTLPEGSYRLSTGADVGGYGAVAVIDTVALGDDDVVEDITLPPPGTLTINVNKPDGSPAAGVRITVNSTGHATGQTSNGSAINFYAYPGPTSNGPCVTDADGNCTLHYVTGVGVGFTVTPTTGLSTTGGGTPTADGNTVHVTLPDSRTPTSTVLSLSDATLVYGEEQRETATVQVSGVGTTDNPTGTVAVKDGNATVCSATLSHGTATCSLKATSLKPGTHSLVARYNGNTRFSGSASDSSTVTVTQVATTTDLALSASEVAYGDEDDVVASVTVDGSGVEDAPTGTVTVKAGTTTLCSATLSSGVATCALKPTALRPGTASITATYNGSTRFIGSASSVQTITITQIASTTTLSLSTTSVAYGDETNELATVDVVGDGVDDAPTGSVTLKSNTTTLCTMTLVNGTGTCRLKATALPPGDHPVTAIYNGSTRFIGSTSAPTTVTITQIATATTLSLSASSVAYGSEQSETFTVNVGGAGVSDQPTGTVTVKSNTTTLCTITLIGGTGTCSPRATALRVGTYPVQASYKGSTRFLPSTSDTTTLTVTA